MNARHGYLQDRRHAVLTIGLCFLVALLEGLDLQSVGVAAPRMAREFGLSVSQMGIAFSAGTFGLLPGAMLGGLVLGLAESFTTGYFSGNYEDMLAFGILILILIFRPDGILGKATVQKV